MTVWLPPSTHGRCSRTSHPAGAAERRVVPVEGQPEDDRVETCEEAINLGVERGAVTDLHQTALRRNAGIVRSMSHGGS